VLLDRGLGCLGAELLDVGGNTEGLDVVQFELVLVAPIEELLMGAEDQAVFLALPVSVGPFL
jgi:hypothetical protein